MTKVDLIEAVYVRVGAFSKADSAEIVEAVLQMMKEAMQSGEKIKISGFGNFVVREKRARMGRNPQTGEAIEIEPRRVLTFKASKVLKDSMNKSR